MWVLGSIGTGTQAVAQDPPFWGTVWVDPDIIRPGDWTAYQTMSYTGIAQRSVFDRRDNFLIHQADAHFRRDVRRAIRLYLLQLAGHSGGIEMRLA